MRGKLTLKSEMNKGSTFTINLHTEGVVFNCDDGISTSRSEAHLNRLYVLVFIEDEFNKEILKKFLMKQKCLTTFSDNQEDFDNKFEHSSRFNVYIVDLDGYKSNQVQMLKKLIRSKKQNEASIGKNFSMLILTTTMNLD